MTIFPCCAAAGRSDMAVPVSSPRRIGTCCVWLLLQLLLHSAAVRPRQPRHSDNAADDRNFLGLTVSVEGDRPRAASMESP